jgi:hypothetical protein
MSNIEAQQEEREVERDEAMQRSLEQMAAELKEMRALMRAERGSAQPGD